jgi:hypothetical protein
LAPVYLAYSLCCGTQSFEAILTLSRQNTFQAVTGWDDCLEDKSDLEEDHPPTMELLSPAIPSSSLNVVANATQSIVVEEQYEFARTVCTSATVIKKLK